MLYFSQRCYVFFFHMMCIYIVYIDSRNVNVYIHNVCVL